MKPLPAALVTGAPLLAAVAAWSPLWLAAATVGAALLLLAAPPPRRVYAMTAVSSGVIVFVINPFVAVQGLTVLWQGPHIPMLDTQITAEELVYGAGAGMRVAASALAVAAFVRLADADLLLRAVARVAPRSAMIAALSTRMLPALERDAAGIVTAARTRAARLAAPRTAAGLLGPLLATRSSDRSAVAEAMEARGYGGPGRTRARRAAGDPARVGARRVGAAASGAGDGRRLIGGATSYRYYDTLGDPLQPARGGRRGRAGRAARGRGGDGAMAALSFEQVTYATRARPRRPWTASTCRCPPGNSCCWSAGRARASRRCSGRRSGSCRTSTAASCADGCAPRGWTRATTARASSPAMSDSSSRTPRPSS